ncbi:MAG: hypothetical protein DRI90_25620 [Deltaproteobacteria bacterium]|nr:MAG: hypothetical protein DRI90_25620 [Deltaproteobacteria bacterium]
MKRMSRRKGDVNDAVWAATLSLGLHLALSLFCLSFIESPQAAPALGPPPREPSQRTIEVGLELPQVSTALRLSHPRGKPLQLVLPSGSDLLPRPDVKRAGRGGSDEVDAPAVNLAPRDDEAHLVPAIRSRIDRAQEARTRTGQQRRSPEDDRVGRQPMMLTFVADGAGQRQEPRPAAQLDPAGGGWRAPHPARAAALFESESKPLWGQRTVVRPPEAAATETPDDAAGAGSAARSTVMNSAAGQDSRASAEVATARPQTIRGAESSPANRRGNQQDDVDSEQEVVTKTPALLRASTAGGFPGAGPGGQRGGSQPGAGGVSGPGSTARALGSGPGQGTGANSGDTRRRRYLRAMWSKIHGSWSGADFPKWALFEGRQGYTIVSFVVLRDGGVTALRISRPSGIPEFDAKMLRAVQRASPFGPLPRELGLALRHSHEFVVSNPAVRPPRR